MKRSSGLVGVVEHGDDVARGVGEPRDVGAPVRGDAAGDALEALALLELDEGLQHRGDVAIDPMVSTYDGVHLWALAAAKQGGDPVEIIAAAGEGGYNVAGLLPMLKQLAPR